MKKILAAAGIAALAGCASVPKPTETTPAALTCAAASASPACARVINVLDAASAKLQAAENDVSSGFAFRGRVAISQGSNGGNAGIEWDAESLRTYSVELTAPITSQSWRLDVTPAQATVHGMKGGPRSGSDPTLLLQQATGWTIPVNEMRYWVRALPAPGSAASNFVFGAVNAARPLGFTQAGWTLKFEGGEAGGPPQRIFANKGESQVRLIIDTWSNPPKP